MKGKAPGAAALHSLAQQAAELESSKRPAMAKPAELSPAHRPAAGRHRTANSLLLLQTLPAAFPVRLAILTAWRHAERAPLGLEVVHTLGQGRVLLVQGSAALPCWQAEKQGLSLRKLKALSECSCYSASSKNFRAPWISHSYTFQSQL